MKFEKINEDKIKVILNISDLSSKNIDFHSFMSNPLNSQDFFSTILDIAKKETGFNTEDYNIKIEIFSISNIDFIITLTRLPIKKLTNNHCSSTKTQFLDKNNNTSLHQLHNSRKSMDLPTSVAIYNFNTLNDFYEFSVLISHMHFSKFIAKRLILYEYEKKYFLLIDNLNVDCSENYKIYSIITDFATYVHNSDIFSKKLSEYGKIIIKNNALALATKF